MTKCRSNVGAYLEYWEIEGLAHLLDLFHDLPVGDLGPGLLELGQLDRDVEPRDGFEEQSLGLEKVKSVFDIVASLDHAHDAKISWKWGVAIKSFEVLI